MLPLSVGPSDERDDIEETDTRMDEGVLPSNEEEVEEDTPSDVAPEVVSRIASCLVELKRSLSEAPRTTVSGPMREWREEVEMGEEGGVGERGGEMDERGGGRDGGREKEKLSTYSPCSRYSHLQNPSQFELLTHKKFQETISLQ